MDFDAIVENLDAEYAENGVTTDADGMFEELVEQYPENVAEIKAAIEDFYQIEIGG